MSIAQIDHLVASLKNTSADDKNTWLVCFQSIYVPYVHKVSGCKGLLESVIRSYENADLDAYSQFDAYKRIASIIHGAQEKTIQNLKKTVANAARYGASATEINGLNADIESIKALELPALYDNIECIPAIRNFNNQKDTTIAAELAKIGINAKQSYATAMQGA